MGTLPIIVNDRRHHAKYQNEMAAHPIPMMTDPLGQGWRQPHRSEIVVDATHALMTLDAFKRLADYSASFPTGVYVGKMWRRHNGIYDRAFLAAGGKPEWQLWWYGHAREGVDPEKYVSNNHRKIILLDAEIEEQK